ncbi:hypothetical protein, partial [Roseospira navarrensis]|uniref:hypothetical protein n=1 Tax=Roseospira navarrensis TaxID=140058 RepID=UPI0031B5C963
PGHRHHQRPNLLRYVDRAGSKGISLVIFSTKVGGPQSYFDIGIPKISNYYLLDKWYNDERDGLVRDFVGPSMDTGFRVSTKATPRKCTVSLEAALLLSLVVPPKEYENKIVLRYEGRETLKGVIGGRPYPIFWADTHLDDELSKMEDNLKGPKRQDASHIRQFCSEFIKENEEYLFRPFVHESTEPLLNIKPENYENHLNHTVTQWKNEKEKLDTEIRLIPLLPARSTYRRRLGLWWWRCPG